MNWQEFYASIQEYYHIENENTVIKVPFKNITDITADKLVYKNNDGVTSQIHLKECVKNFSPSQHEIQPSQTCYR